jgi:hypothetical protein
MSEFLQFRALEYLSNRVCRLTVVLIDKGEKLVTLRLAEHLTFTTLKTDFLCNMISSPC